MNLLDVNFYDKKVSILQGHNFRLSFKYLDDATEANLLIARLQYLRYSSYLNHQRALYDFN